MQSASLGPEPSPGKGSAHPAARFDDRSMPAQVLVAGVVPLAVGALAGALIGLSAAAYWVVAALAGVGAFAGGFEHRDGWDAADRGLVGGVVYGVSLLGTHTLLGAHAKVSLGSFTPLLVVLAAIIGMLLSAVGGRIGRIQRERVARASRSDDSVQPLPQLLPTNPGLPRERLKPPTRGP